MKPFPRYLSKTKIMHGYRCHKCIYLSIHHPELEAPITPELQALFDQGNRVGAKAREYYPQGKLITNKPWDFIGALASTQELIAAGHTLLYEAAFAYQGCYARADIMQYSENSKRWHILEVKSTTKVKPEHYDDVGIQAWIITKSGLAIEKISIVHLNPECHYPDLSNLFIEVDVTQIIRERYLTIQPKLHELVNVLKKPEIPEADIGPYCFSPTPCGFMAYCWQQKNIPAMSIFNLPNLMQRKWELYAQGIINLDDPRLTDLNELQYRMIDCHQTGLRYINQALIAEHLATWIYPLTFLDFETINPAIPRYSGCHPFSHVPFQFSVHQKMSATSPVTHVGFLHETDDDPRPSLIPALLQACGEEGSIVAYFARFEKERIQELAQHFPEYQHELLNLTERLVDPLLILRECIYDKAFLGSFSLKKVAPALLGEDHSYQDMLIADGNAAQRAFDELISNHTSLERKNQLKHAMLAYCHKDTEVLVKLVDYLVSIGSK